MASDGKPFWWCPPPQRVIGFRLVRRLLVGGLGQSQRQAEIAATLGVQPRQMIGGNGDRRGAHTRLSVSPIRPIALARVAV